jgi:dihydroneopterin aldolase
MAPLPSHKYARLMQDYEAHTIIRVRDLSTEAYIGADLWGVEGPSNRVQPILLTAWVSLHDSFTSAAQTDTLTNSTVNYSDLSKEILKVISSRRPDVSSKQQLAPHAILANTL